MKRYPHLTVVGLLGGIASGKSYVAKLLAELGAAVLDADRAGHEALREPAVETAARTRWGNGIFGDDGHIDRKRLASIVFADPAQLAYLESLTHPLIGAKLEAQMEKLSNVGQPRIVVLDAPVLLKAGWQRYCDTIVFVDAPENIRLKRAAARGWDAAEVHRREAQQEPLEVKKKLASEVLDNTGDEAAIKRQVAELFERLTAMA